MNHYKHYLELAASEDRAIELIMKTLESDINNGLEELKNERYERVGEYIYSIADNVSELQIKLQKLKSEQNKQEQR